MKAEIKEATFPAQLEQLSAINDFVTEAAEAAALDNRSIYAVQMAVEEATANIIQHAYAGEDAQNSIHCRCVIEDGRLVVIMRDEGRPFDPDVVPDPDLCSPLEERQAGGLGVYFIRELMDEVHFDCVAGRTNVLTMVRRRRTT